MAPLEIQLGLGGGGRGERDCGYELWLDEKREDSRGILYGY